MRRDGLRPLFEILQRTQQAMQPFAGLQRQIHAIRIPQVDANAYRVALSGVRESQRRIADVVEKLNFWPAATNLAETFRIVQTLDDAGWLPHYSTPFDRCGECVGDPDALHVFLSHYYREQWTEVRRAVEVRLTLYDVDDEARATFHEALAAHESGLYRSVCRVLLPELERVSRRELHGNGMEPITSQKDLREVAAQLPLSSVEPRGLYNMHLFRRLSQHLYEHVNNEEDRQRFAQDPVPNRHAALHGLVVYASMQNSLNTLFMGEYIFQVIDALKGLMMAPSPDGEGPPPG